MKKIVLFVSLFSIAVACSSGDDSGSSSSDNFDRTALLTHWADNIIIPGYEDYQSKVATLVDDVAAFNNNPTEASLQTLRASWLEAYKSYQKVAIFYLGQAAEIKFREAANTYPADIVGIEANITSGTYNLSQFAQFPKQGFPALDYLINSFGTNDAAIVLYYTTDPAATAHKTYMTNVANKLKSDADTVVADWNTGYRETYIASTGTAVSSSVNKTTNLFVKTIEKDIRTGKIGIPAGLFSGGTTFPDKVEGYYKNDISKELYNVSLQAAQDFFNGKEFNSTATGPSLKSYLDHVNAMRSGQKLSDIINAQFQNVYTINATLNNSFSQQINSDNTKMIDAYNVLQQNVIYVKLDMMQALNIPIDYVDGDGD